MQSSGQLQAAAIAPYFSSMTHQDQITVLHLILPLQSSQHIVDNQEELTQRSSSCNMFYFTGLGTGLPVHDVGSIQACRLKMQACINLDG